MKILLTSAGGPASENVAQCLYKDRRTKLIGIDCDSHMLTLSSIKKKFVVHHSSEATALYIDDINYLSKTEKVTMLYPQSDRELFICSIHKDDLPSMTIPSFEFIAACRDKAALYEFMQEEGFPIPKGFERVTDNTRVTSPMWVRSTIGAGGYLAYRVDTIQDLRSVLAFNKKKQDWMICEYLDGKDYCLNSLWSDGKMVTGILKERIKWVYNRIGTTAVQRTVVDTNLVKQCESVVTALCKKYDKHMSGLIMIDLKEDVVTKQVYITEVNAGRTGTVSYFFSAASQKIYGDQRTNLPLQHTLLHHRLSTMPVKKYNPLPENIFWYRHIDMTPRLVDDSETQRLSNLMIR